MSRVYFHSADHHAELSGSERAYAGNLNSEMALSVLTDFRARERYERLVPPDHYLRGNAIKDESWMNSFLTWWKVGMDSHEFDFDGYRITPWQVILNTAIVMGSSAIELLARIHATCEIHGYVEGPHREWLADIIEEGRANRVLRPRQGWNEVEALLREADDSPVVMSYSVSDGFPNAGIAKAAGLWSPGPDHEGHYTAEQEAEQRLHHEERAERERKGNSRSVFSSWPYNGPTEGEYWWDGDEWYDIDPKEQWAMGVEAIRQTPGIDLTPDIWGERFFSNPDQEGRHWSIFDVQEWLNGEST